MRSRARIAERPPDPLALARAHREPVGIVDLRPPVVGHAAIVLAALIHARQRRDAEAADRFARIDRSVHVDHLRRAGRQREAIGAGRAHRIQQAVEHERARVGRRPLEPERDEARKLLDVLRGVDREPARGETELPRVAAARAEIARAEKHGDVLVPVRRGVHAKARERQIRRQLVADRCRCPRTRTCPGGSGSRALRRRTISYSSTGSLKPRPQ